MWRYFEPRVTELDSIFLQCEQSVISFETRLTTIKLHEHGKLLVARWHFPFFFLNCSCFFLSRFDKEKRQNANFCSQKKLPE